MKKQDIATKEYVRKVANSLPMDSEEIYHMPAEKNKKVWCVVAVVLFAGIVFALLFI